jgi:hypothetical protein
MRGRPLAVGVALVFSYVVIVAVTGATGRHVRPLYEGIGGPPPYQWVHPPPAFASSNVKPRPIESRISLGPGGSPLTGTGTPDAQLVLSLAQGAIPPHEGDVEATVRISPLDPAILGRLPSGLRADGNAYRVELAYQPSAQAVDAVASPGNILLTMPEPSQGLLFSSDGRRWQRLTTQHVTGAAQVGAPFSQAGYYLGAASSPPPSRSGGGTSTGWIIAMGVLIAALTLALGLGVRRFRRRPAGARPRRRPRT